MVADPERNEECMSNTVSHSPFEMVFHLEYLQVRAPGTLNVLLAAPNVGLIVVLCPPGLMRKCAYTHP